MPVTWSDAIDEVIGGDLTAALAYVTPAGGAVVTAVAPIGLRDRGEGTVSFTTSLGFGQKLERIERDPRIALAYHAREHGHSLESATSSSRAAPASSDDPTAPISSTSAGRPTRSWARRSAASSGTAGCPPTTPTGTRFTSRSSGSWAGRTCAARATRRCTGASCPPSRRHRSRPPKRNRTAGRRRSCGQRATRAPHELLAYRGGDGYPVVVPVGGRRGLRRRSDPAPSRAGRCPRRAPRRAAGSRVPREADRAGSAPAHRLARGPGLRSRSTRRTPSGFRAPANKTLLLLGNGFLAKRGLKRARKAAA